MPCLDWAFTPAPAGAACPVKPPGELLSGVQWKDLAARLWAEGSGVGRSCRNIGSSHSLPCGGWVWGDVCWCRGRVGGSWGRRLWGRPGAARPPPHRLQTAYGLAVCTRTHITQQQQAAIGVKHMRGACRAWSHGCWWFHGCKVRAFQGAFLVCCAAHQHSLQGGVQYGCLGLSKTAVLLLQACHQNM